MEESTKKMDLIEFKDLPDKSTPLTSENLNHNFKELAKGIDEASKTGAGGIAVQEEEPTDESDLLWIKPSESAEPVDCVVDSLDGNETTKAPSVRAVKNKLEVLNGYVLFDGDEQSEVTLNDDVSNYKYLEIYYYTDNINSGISSIKTITDYNIVNITDSYYGDRWGYNANIKLKLDGKKITKTSEYRLGGSNNNFDKMWIKDSNFHLVKVIGYKEV